MYDWLQAFISIVNQESLHDEDADDIDNAKNESDQLLQYPFPYV